MEIENEGTEVNKSRG